MGENGRGRTRADFRASDELLAGADKLAKRNNETRSDVIRTAVAEHLARHGVEVADRSFGHRFRLPDGRVCSDVAREHGVAWDTAYRRIRRGWDTCRACTEPPAQTGRRAWVR